MGGSTSRRRKVRLAAGTLSAMILVATAACGSSSAPNASSNGQTGKSPIVIGLVGDLTGVSSSTFADGPGGAQARIDLQNAHGGVNGHQLKLVVADDQSSPTTVVTAVQDLVENKGAFGIISDSAFSYAAANYEHSQEVPETAVCACGPSYDQLPNTNLFPLGGAAPAVFNGVFWTNDVEAKFLKQIGATKMAGLGYGISAASTDSIKLLYAAGQPLGVKQCYTNYSVPFGAVDFTAISLQIKSANCNSVVGSFVDASDVALAGAVKNAGITAKQLYFTGYDEDVLANSTSESAFDGSYVATNGPNFTTPNAPTQSMLDALKKYDKSYKGGIPDLGLWGSYIAADLMIKGLEMAGTNPTHSAFIDHLRQVSNYNAEGILPTTYTFQHFGTPQMLPKQPCMYFMQLKGSKFVVYNGNKPICGKELAAPGVS